MRLALYLPVMVMAGKKRNAGFQQISTEKFKDPFLLILIYRACNDTSLVTWQMCTKPAVLLMQHCTQRSTVARRRADECRPCCPRPGLWRAKIVLREGGLAFEVVLHPDLHSTSPSLLWLQYISTVHVPCLPLWCVCQQGCEGALTCLSLQKQICDAKRGSTHCNADS